MPPTLGQRFGPDYAGLPTHISTQDYSIWQRFRAAIPPSALALYFDVRLGSGRELAEDTDPDAKALWYHLTTKRADVLIEMPAGWLLIELRDHAQSSAIGRLLLYQKLWKADPPDQRPLSLLLVSNSRDPDVEALAADHAIGYLIV